MNGRRWIIIKNGRIGGGMSHAVDWAGGAAGGGERRYDAGRPAGDGGRDRARRADAGRDGRVQDGRRGGLQLPDRTELPARGAASALCPRGKAPEADRHRVWAAARGARAWTKPRPRSPAAFWRRWPTRWRCAPRTAASTPSSCARPRRKGAAKRCRPLNRLRRC